jgi:hypothetical protein
MGRGTERRNIEPEGAAVLEAVALEVEHRH